MNNMKQFVRFCTCQFKIHIQIQTLVLGQMCHDSVMSHDWVMTHGRDKTGALVALAAEVHRDTNQLLRYFRMPGGQAAQQLKRILKKIEESNLSIFSNCCLLGSWHHTQLCDILWCSWSAFWSFGLFFSQTLVYKNFAVLYQQSLSFTAGMASVLQWRSSLKYVIFDDFGTDEGVMRAPWCQRSKHVILIRCPTILASKASLGIIQNLFLRGVCYQSCCMWFAICEVAYHCVQCSPLWLDHDFEFGITQLENGENGQTVIWYCPLVRNCMLKWESSAQGSERVCAAGSATCRWWCTDAKWKVWRRIADTRKTPRQHVTTASITLIVLVRCHK